MEATELRISNIVNCNDKRHHEPYIVVESITSECINVDFRPYNLNELEPIPLTEDWLLKLGFVKRADCEFDFWKNSMWKLKEYKNKKYYQLYHCSDEVDCTMIKFVHQIQNLFYSLTGEELKII